MIMGKQEEEERWLRGGFPNTGNWDRVNPRTVLGCTVTEEVRVRFSQTT